MSRISNAFLNKAKIAYLTAGDNVEYFLALVKAGVNILEIGIPFSDPIADGPVIQKAMQKSLNNNTDINQVLEIVKIIRSKTDVGIIIFTYLNPIMYNIKDFLIKCKDAGADGILIIDLPFEESDEIRFLCASINLFFIPVATPSTPLSRINFLTRNCSGFLYYACRKGTTGIREELPKELLKEISKVKLNSFLPVAVGFGISNNSMVKQILSISDGCVVGSYFVDQQVTPKELEILARKMFYDN